MVVNLAFKSIILSPLSWLYGAGVGLRNLAYTLGIIPKIKIPVPVLSIGNLTVGGTGKTQFIIDLIPKLTEEGVKCAILSRGYGRKTKGFFSVNENIHSTLEVGDEAVMLKSIFPEIEVAVCEDRVLGVLKILEKNKPDIIILDDAFQHRRIHRDLDIVLLDASIAKWKWNLLPLGRQREAQSALKRADLCLLSKCQSESSIQNLPLIDGVKDFPAFDIRPLCMYSFEGSQQFEASVFPFVHVFLFSGLGNSAQFQASIESAGFIVVGHAQFSDHHSFTEREIVRILDKFDRLNQNKSAALLCTEKDFFRMKNNPVINNFLTRPVFYVRPGLVWLKGKERVEEKIMTLTSKNGRKIK